MDIDYADPDEYNYDYYYNHFFWRDFLHFYEGFVCIGDYLEIRDGPSEQSPLIGGYCGDETSLSLPIEIQTTQENAWMRCAGL